MNSEQEVIIRFIQSNLRQIRQEIDEMFFKKQQLEKLADQFYTAYLDDLWNRCNIQLNELYDKLFKRFGTMYRCQSLLLRAKLGEEISQDDVSSIDIKS